MTRSLDPALLPTFHGSLRVRYKDIGSVEPLVRIEQRLRDLRMLLFTGYWADFAAGADRELVLSPLPELNAGIRIRSLTYGSPLNLVAEVATTSAACAGAVRGVVYLMNRWEDWRERHAEVNYRIGVYAMLQKSIPTVEELSQRPDGQFFPTEGPRLPTTQELGSAVEALNEIDRFEPI